MNVLSSALHCSDLDQAIGLIQFALGIESGDVAGLACTEALGPHPNIAWRHLKIEGRRDLLAHWLHAELLEAR
jgi:hypothetical protein